MLSRRYLGSGHGSAGKAQAKRFDAKNATLFVLRAFLVPKYWFRTACAITVIVVTGVCIASVAISPLSGQYAIAGKQYAVLLRPSKVSAIELDPLSFDARMSVPEKQIRVVRREKEISLWFIYVNVCLQTNNVVQVTIHLARTCVLAWSCVGLATCRYLFSRILSAPHTCQCGYSLQGNVSGICPECGTPIPSAQTNPSVNSVSTNPVIERNTTVDSP
jgi:hypothetical protein